MTMKYDDLVPFFNHPCEPNLELFDKIENFLRTKMAFEWISANFYGVGGGTSLYTSLIDCPWLSKNW